MIGALHPARRQHLDAVADVMADACDDVRRCFADPARVRITLLVRDPAHPDGSRDVVVTDDELDAAIRALELRREEGA